MRKALLAAFVALLTIPTLAPAQERVTLGYGRMFNNDALGDGRDRWRTGSYAISMVRGPEWTGAAPGAFGALLEFRGRMEIIAPANLASPAPVERRYVGALSLGVHSHFQTLGAEARLGLDVVATGPQTGVGRLQTELHRLFGIAAPGSLANQIGNAFHPTISGELGKSFRIGNNSTIRPFAEAQAGVENYLRIGGDITFGGFGQRSLMLRDQVSGQRYFGIEGDSDPGFSLTMGGDIARVYSSAYLPSGGAAVLRDSRSRLRVGLRWRGEKSELFYGVTHLGREFQGQPTGQTVGSLRLKVRF